MFWTCEGLDVGAITDIWTFKFSFSEVEECLTFSRATFSPYVHLLTTFKAPRLFSFYLHFKYHVLAGEHSVKDLF